MQNNITLTFCTYFKKIKQFKYEYETYDKYTVFCVKSGLFEYQIGDEAKSRLSEGELVICPPGYRFYRRIIEPCEFCMIKFTCDEFSSVFCKKIKLSDILRLNYDLKMLENCLFCDDFSKEPLFLHYCTDILYLALNSTRNNNLLSASKEYIEQNYNKKIKINELAKKSGYTTPHFINKFKIY